MSRNFKHGSEHFLNTAVTFEKLNEFEELAKRENKSKSDLLREAIDLVIRKYTRKFRFWRR
jgi:metal-responsive CopG/Arc/MetJ family transcriptional regulator